jgi:thiamine kinase-like enzyme
VDPEEIAARVWPGAQPRLEPLGGGITNHNFKVETEEGVFVLRIGGKDTHLLGIDRRAEHEASRAAAALGIGPEVVAFLDAEGCLITRFIAGEPVDVHAAGTVAAVGEALRRIHAGPALRSRFDAFRVVEVYCSTATAHGVRVPDAYERAQRQAHEIERARGAQPARLCHNDLLHANFIDDGERLWIVDWEYAGMGDVFFDLANFSVNNELSEDEERELLRSYTGHDRPRDLAELCLMRFMSDFREAMWGVVQQGISDLDFDFVGYADEHFQRLARTADEPRFREALNELGRTGGRDGG